MHASGGDEASGPRCARRTRGSRWSALRKASSGTSTPSRARFVPRVKAATSAAPSHVQPPGLSPVVPGREPAGGAGGGAVVQRSRHLWVPSAGRPMRQPPRSPNCGTFRSNSADDALLSAPAPPRSPSASASELALDTVVEGTAATNDAEGGGAAPPRGRRGRRSRRAVHGRQEAPLQPGSANGGHRGPLVPQQEHLAAEPDRYVGAGRAGGGFLDSCASN
ncbi:unnamed protein product [Lampetra planeri]